MTNIYQNEIKLDFFLAYLLILLFDYLLIITYYQ